METKRLSGNLNLKKGWLALWCFLVFSSAAQISTFPYFENFEAGQGGWIPGGILSDWTYGTPAKPIITGAGGGTKCWINGGLTLTGVGYNYNEVSYVVSPTFNFSSLAYPWISFKLFWETEKKWDGGNLQYSLNGGTTWVRVGAVGDPVDCMNDNWYNTNSISQLISLDPSKQGWGGNHYPAAATGTGNANATGAGCQLGSGSMSWLVSKHCLVGLAGQPNVKFRFTFGAGSTCNYYDGLAFDDILIQEGLQNAPDFSLACAATPNSINFTSILPACPNPASTTLAWNFGDPGSGASNTSSAVNPLHTFSASGVYTISLTQTGGPCNPPGIITHTVSIMNSSMTATTSVTCFGGNNGSATSTVSNGTTPYTYSWSPTGGNSLTGTNLTAGNYTLTIQDALGCKKTSTVTILQPAALTAAPLFTNVLCNAGNTGAASVTAGGGISGYTYSWTPSGGTSASTSNLVAGSYSVIVKDANNCQTNASVTITQPSTLNVSVSVTNTPCGNSIGSVSLTTSGGTPNYSYAWSPNVSSGSSANSLGTGVYAISITDNNACVSTVTANLTSSNGPTVAITHTNILCYGGNTGIAAATVTGGTGALSYSWSPSGGTGLNASNLPAGNYNLIATDAIGCTGTFSVYISQPTTPLTTVLSGTPVTCNGSANGMASAIANGGTPGYTYSWSPGGGSGTTINSLSPTTYSLTVTDLNNCITTHTILMTEPTSLTTVISASNITCSGLSNGTASVTASGGNSGYIYNWLPGGGTNAVTPSNLSTGNYSVTVTDAKGCAKTATVTITQPLPLIVTATGGNVTCYGQTTGSVSATASGGVGSYAYHWQPSASTNSIVTGLGAGTYSVTITDANNCSKTDVASVTQPPQLFITASADQTICIGQSASLTASVSGSPTYTINWQPMNNNANTVVVSPVTSTTYTAIATNSAGCTSAPTVIAISIAPSVSLTVINSMIVCGGAAVTLTTSATGGSGNYQYIWLPTNETTSSVTFTATTPKQFTVNVSDGCTAATKTMTVSVSIKPTIKNFPPVSGCAPLCIHYYDSTLIKSGVIASWNWNFTNGEVSASASPTICFTNGGNYNGTLNIVTTNNCSYKLADISGITVIAKPHADFVSDIGFESTEYNSTFVFTNSSSNYTSIQWDYPTPVTYGNSITKTFPDTGTYSVTLIASNTGGCIDTVTKLIVIRPEFTFYAPNCFTPNNNTLNDTFLPIGTGWDVSTFKMTVFDRWGELIYQTHDAAAGWDATHKNHTEKVKEDVYIWKVELKDIFHKEHSYVGHVTILK